jgi:hypothetical protein
MRDFRDAKSMAHSLRDALKAKAVETTHSECLELIAKAFGFDSWNILSAKIDAAERHAGAERPSSSADAAGLARQNTLYCSFCGKNQHEVRKLVAGPAVFICDECIELCTDFVDDPLRDEELSRLKEGDAENARTMSTEQLAHYVERGRKGVQRSQLTLQGIERKLAMRDGEVPAKDDILALPRFHYLKTKTRAELAGLQLTTQLELSRYEDALRLATAALGARRQ